MEHRENDLAPLIERPRPTILAAAATMLLAAVGLWISSVAAARLSTGGGAWQEFAFAMLYYLPFIALPILLYAVRRPGISASMRLNPLPVIPTLAIISAAMLSVYIASAADALWELLLNALGLHEPDVTVEITTSRTLTMAILHSAAMPAIFEELLCRGFVFPAFESRGTWLGIGVSALLFALLHGNIYGLPAYLLVGAISAFLVFATDSLYAGMVYHTVYNTFILVILYMLPRVSGDTTAAATSAAAASSQTSVLSIVIDVATFGLLLFLLLRLLDCHRRMRGIEPVPRVREPLKKGEWALLILLSGVLLGSCALVLMGV